MRQRVLEHQRIRGEAVDIRRGPLAVAVATQPVGTQRIDGDQDHVGWSRRGIARTTRDLCGEYREQER